MEEAENEKVEEVPDAPKLSQLEVFRSSIAERHMNVDFPDEQEWRYFDTGGVDSSATIVCLPDLGGNAESFYQLVLGLKHCGYRIISCEYGVYTKHSDWIQAFDRFLNSLRPEVETVHLFGAHLGGFLAQMYAETYSRRVSSLLLCNTFGDTKYYSHMKGWFLTWMPDFVVKRKILAQFSTKKVDNAIADSIDFMVEQVEALDTDLVVARINLMSQARDIRQLRLRSKFVTIVEAIDDDSRSEKIKDDLHRRYPESHQAFIKRGGRFCYISNPEEVVMYIRIHMRNVGVKVDLESPSLAEKSS